MNISCPGRGDVAKKFFIRHIRKDLESDQHAVLELTQRCYRTTEGWTHEAGIVSGHRITATDLRKELESPKSTILLAEDRASGNIVGCVKTGLTSETAAGPLEEEMGYFGLFAVAPEFQSQGLGTYLQSEAELECRRRGVSKMVGLFPFLTEFLFYS